MGNGFFRLTGTGGAFGLEIKAPSGGGEPVRVKEVTDYLAQHNVACDLSALKNAINQGKDTVFQLGIGKCPAVAMSYQLSIDEDGMRATARLYPPSQTGQPISVQEFLGDLRFKQISFGIKEERIRKAFEQGEYCTDITVAEGQPARQGKDAFIEYYFNTDVKVRPTVKEDGSVDFFHLNTVNHCHEGDVLARLIPADPGEDGSDIYGNRIKPAPVKSAVLKCGKNIEISEDRTVLTSKVNGHVSLTDDKVFVSDILQLENVDTSTGNIEYAGSIEVRGNVQANFSVRAEGNIIVNGLAEGAYLEAGGDIIIARGMAGMNKGELKAGGNIVVKFLESARASAGGYITAESVLHSTVMAGGDITVDGRKGFITGGRVCATNLVQVKSLGSPMGTSTVVEVGTDPAVKVRHQELQKDVAELNKVIRSLDPIITSYAQKRRQGVKFSQEQMKYLSSVLKLREQKMTELEHAVKEMEALQETIEQQSHAQVVVKGEVFPGTKIAIGDVSMVVQSRMEYCKFVKLRGDVKMVGI